MNRSTKLLMASLPAMPAIEAKTMAMVNSMQLKTSALTTEPVMLVGTTRRTKKMRVKLMMETLVVMSSAEDTWKILGFLRRRLPCAYKELDTCGNLVV